MITVVFFKQNTKYSRSLSQFLRHHEVDTTRRFNPSVGKLEHRYWLTKKGQKQVSVHAVLEDNPKVKPLTKEELWEQGQRISLTVEARLPRVTRADGTTQGMVPLQFSATVVSDPATGEKLGTIGSGVGHVVFSMAGEVAEAWMIRHDDLWWAFLKAREEAK